jgi:hypothetical protein
MSEFVYYDERHIYTLDGVVLPGVTGVIDNGLHPYAGVPKELLDRAARFGSAMHLMVKYYLAGELDEETLDEPLQGCLAGFKKFQNDYHHFFDEECTIEKPGYHPKLKYAGTPDLDFPSRVIDTKSRETNMLTDGIQVGAYDHMTGKGNRERYVLELYQDGSYKLVRLNPTKKSGDLAWSRFRYLLDFYNMGKEVERWTK